MKPRPASVNYINTGGGKVKRSKSYRYDSYNLQGFMDSKTLGFYSVQTLA